MYRWAHLVFYTTLLYRSSSHRRRRWVLCWVVSLQVACQIGQIVSSSSGLQMSSSPVAPLDHTVWSMVSFSHLFLPRAQYNPYLHPRSEVVDWYRCRPRTMHLPTLPPRALPYGSPRPDSCPQRRHDHPRTGDCVWNQRWLCERERRLAVGGRIERGPRHTTTLCVGIPT